MAGLFRPVCRIRTDLARFVAFSIIAVVSSAIEGGRGVLGDRFVLGRHRPQIREWMQWTACDALGLIIATPGIMYLVRNARGDDDLRRSLTMFLARLCLAVTIASFIWGRAPLLLFSYPLLTLVSFRVRPVWTSALNRRTFEPAVEARMRLSATGAVLIVDLDHSKQINDMFGHRMLQDVNGLVTRSGGEAFVAFTSGVRSTPELEALCSRICHELVLPYDMPAVGRAVTLSIGAALSGPRCSGCSQGV